MWNYLCVYNPDLGDEDAVEQQLLHTDGSTDFVKLIGLSQGIAELAYAFGGSPARWFETDNTPHKGMIVIVPLAVDPDNKPKDSNWRPGYWFAGEYTRSPGSLSPLAAYRSVELAFRQHCLLYGQDFASKEYWSKFTHVINSIEPKFCSLVAPDAIRFAPGSLNPEVARSVDTLARQNNAQDIMITTEDGAIYPGGRISFETRREILRWLSSRTNSKSQPQSVATSNQNVDSAKSPSGQISEAQNEPDLEDISAVGGDCAGGGATAVAAAAAAANASTESVVHQQSSESLQASSPKQRTPDTTTEESLSSKFTKYLPFGVPSVPISMPSMSMPSVSLPSVSMPSVSMPSISMPGISTLTTPLDSISRSRWWLSEPSVDTNDPLLFENIELVSQNGSKMYLTSWSESMYTYTVIFPEITDLSSYTETLVKPLVRSMEGFSFAFAPPVRFYYMVFKGDRETVSTFPDSVGNEVFRTLLAGFPDTQQVIRLGSTWLYFITMSDGAKAVFGKKNVDTAPSFLGALHSDVKQWIDDYERKHGSRHSFK